MYNLIEYSDNYSDTSGSLWQFKRDEVLANNADLSIDNNGKFNSQSFKYKAAFVGKTEDAANGNSFVKNKNSCSIEIFKQFLETIRNAIN